MPQFNILAKFDGPGIPDRHFLVEAIDREVAIVTFILETNRWEPKACIQARCLAGGEGHQGALSVWEGKEGKTAVLCQTHGENPPGSDS